MPSRSQPFGPQVWACWLGVTVRWIARIDDGVLHVEAPGAVSAAVSVLDVSSTVRRGWFWSHLQIDGLEGGTPGGSGPAGAAAELRGLSRENAERFLAALAHARAATLNRLHQQLQADHDRLVPLTEALKRDISAPRYLAARDRLRIVGQVLAERPLLASVQARIESRYARQFPVTKPLGKALELLRTLCADGDVILQSRNDHFVERELGHWRSFFDHCEERPLTDEQARAAIVFEENTLLVAAAGSGKTSTVVGKVAYALAKGLVRPEDILCLAFNTKAAQEIGDRLQARLRAMTARECPIDEEIKTRLASMLSGGLCIESRTFHSLGLKVVRDVEKYDPKVSAPAENAHRVRRAVERCCQDPRFAVDWLRLQTVARFARPADARFRTEQEYMEYLRGIWRQRKHGRRAAGEDEGILTLGSGKAVRSFEEVAISNWLYLMGVPFEYEAPFEDGAAELCPGRVWTPDFSYRIHDATGERVIVHEHFALNAQGKAPPFFDNPSGYVADAARKQQVLAALDHRHFWTTSAEYLDGTLWPKLQAHLTGLGIELKPRAGEAVLARLKDIGQRPDLELIQRATSQIRQNGWSRETLASRLREQPEPARAGLFLDVAWPVAEAVNELLVEDKHVDFDEMIRRALVYLRDNPALLPFKFILADEFQDTAPGRAEIIRQVLHAREESLFFAVGDDWQAINRFAGSDLSYFTGFGAAFGRSPGANERCDLSRTFRSNQGIADAARTFVLRNRSQLPKVVHSHDPTRHGVIDVCTYYDDAEVLGLVDRTLALWVDQHPRSLDGRKPSVFLLGRYGEKHVVGLSEGQIKALSERWSDRIELIKRDKQPATLYMTMHKSKGLQADYVLILGLFRVEHDWFCFPSEREDDPLLQLVLPPKEALADADERRLFYVALTRAKHQVVVLASQRHPSPYALELLHAQRDGSVLFNGEQALPPLCPACDQGLVFPKPRPSSNGVFYACSDRWGCGKTWPAWPPRQQRGTSSTAGRNAGQGRRDAPARARNLAPPAR